MHGHPATEVPPNCLLQLEGPGVWDLLPNITNPVLLVGGAKDPLMPTKVRSRCTANHAPSCLRPCKATL